MKTRQYTIRSIPQAVDRTLRARAAQTHQSLNTIVLAALQRGLGLTEDPPEFHDLDDLSGTWVSDPEFDRAMEVFESIDEELWKCPSADFIGCCKKTSTSIESNG